MSPQFKNIGFLVTFVFLVYFLRSNQVSLSHIPVKIARALQNSDLLNDFCSGVSETPSFSQSDIDRSISLREDLNNVRRENKTLVALIEYNEPDDTFAGTYFKSMIPMFIPWAVLFVIGAVMCIAFVINWCCMFCSCCRKCAPRCCLPRKSSSGKNFYATFSLILVTLAIGASIAGIIFSSNIPSEANASICRVVLLLDRINQGAPDENWVGINPAMTQIDTIGIQTNNVNEAISNFNTSTSQMSQQLNQAAGLINPIYTQNQGTTIPRINPAEGEYAPEYIQNLGPATNQDTILGAIQAEITQKRDATDVLNEAISVFANIFQQVTQEISNKVEGSKDTLSSISDHVNTVEDKLADNKDTIKTVINVVGGVFLGIFIANLAFLVIAFLSIFLVCCGVRAFSKAIHLSWCALGLLMLLGWVIAVATIIATTISLESCDVGDKALKEPEFFNQTFDKLATLFDIDTADFERTKNVIYRCVHGDGDLATEFGYRDGLVFFGEAFTSINENYNTISEDIGTLPDSIIPSVVSLLNEFRDGTRIDSEDSAVDLVQLNGLTNSNENPCTNLDDTWIFNSVNCTEDLGAVFTGDSSATFNLNNPTCIGYSAWEVSNDDVSARYTTTTFPQPACGNVDGQAMHVYLQNYVAGLANNREQTRTVIDSLVEEINPLTEASNRFDTEIGNIPNNIVAINSTIAPIYELLAGNTGLITVSNCRFVRDDVQAFVDETCVGIGTSFFAITITALVLFFLTLLATFMLFCLAKRIVAIPKIREKENYKVQDVHYGGQRS